MRKHFLDNIRWATVWLVIVYHVFYLYNAQGIFGGIGPFREEQPWEVFCTVVYPWFMVLLYAVAGISARYALEKQSDRAFLKGKVRRLLVPSTLGLCLLPALCGYTYLRLGGSIALIPPALVFPVSMVSGIGPLWFLHLLFLYSWLLTLLRRLRFCEKLYRAGENAGLLVLVGLFFLIFAGAQVLNMPVITTYRLGIYFVSYLVGYFVLSHDAVQERLRRACPALLLGAAAAGAAYVWRFRGEVYCDDFVLKHILTNLYLWLAVLAILGCAKAWADRTGKVLGYLARSSFGVYIVHYAVTLYVCLGLQRTALPVAAVYILAAVLSIGLSVGAQELLRRVPVARYLLFGYRKEKRNVP